MRLRASAHACPGAEELSGAVPPGAADQMLIAALPTWQDLGGRGMEKASFTCVSKLLLI